MSTFFSDTELRCPHCRVNGIHPQLLSKLNQFREKWGSPLLLTSAFRCEAHNTAIGGATNSMHIKGQAVDISWLAMSGSEKAALLKLALSGFSGIGLHKQFLHVDNRPGGPLLWFY